MAVVWTIFFTFTEIWGQVALNGLMVVLGPLMLWGLKRTGRITPWAQLTLAAALLLYGPGVLTQTPIDETGLGLYTASLGALHALTAKVSWKVTRAWRLWLSVTGRLDLFKGVASNRGGQALLGVLYAW